MAADNPKALKTASALGTVSTNVATTAAASATGKIVLVHAAIGSCANAFTWQLKDGSTVLLQGQGPAGCDAGISFGGDRAGIAISSGGTATMLVSPGSGTVATAANLVYEETGNNL